MSGQEDWQAKNATAGNDESPQRIDTQYIKQADEAGHIIRAQTAAIAASIKSTEDVVGEMKTWLRTGVAPDRTRMMTDDALQWHSDYYQVTASGRREEKAIEDGALVDYYYWNSPYLSHIGEMNLVMMHSQVNMPDGTHLPSDRLRKETQQMKNLTEAAKKRLEIAKREDDAFVRDAMDPTKHRGHPLRKDGVYTKMFWRPFHAAEVEKAEAAVSQ